MWHFSGGLAKFIVSDDSIPLVKGLRPLLLQRIDASLPGVKVMRLRLNRHLPEVDSLEAHTHEWSQLLCYLSGTGALLVRGHEHSVVPGTVVWVPRGQRHGFREFRGRRPLCLAIDLQIAPHKRVFTTATLNDSELGKIKHSLAELSRLGNPESFESRLSAASHTLAILDVQFRALGFLPKHSASVPAFVKKFKDLASSPEASGLSIKELTARLGYQPDYLNRVFKRITGLSLSEQRNATRLETAKAALFKGNSSCAILPSTSLFHGISSAEPKAFNLQNSASRVGRSVAGCRLKNSPELAAIVIF